MISVGYKNGFIIMTPTDSVGGNGLAKILGCSTIPDKKKKIDRGCLVVSDSHVEQLNNCLKKEKIAASVEDSFTKYITAYKKELSMDRAKIDVYCINTKITGKSVPHEAIKEVTKFFLAAAPNTPKYKSGDWDGFIHLYDKRKKTFPTGLLQKVVSVLESKKLPYDIEYHYDTSPKKMYNWKVVDGITPDADQIEAIACAIEGKRGIVKAPTGWGKTAVFAKNVVVGFGVPALFIANKKQLLDDAKTDFENGIAGAECLTIKDGMFGRVKMSTKYTPQDLKNALSAPIMVATIQSLSARLRDPQTSDILIDWLNNVCKLVICDEAQSTGTKQWNAVLEEIRAPYRIMLSATPRRTDGATIMLEAYSGPCIFTTTAEEQIKKGRLCELDIVYNTYDHKLYNERDAAVNYQEAYKACIVENKERNLEMIIKPTIELVEEGRHVLVLIQQIEHGHSIRELLVEQGIPADDIRFIWGDTPKKTRQSAIDAFKKGDFKVMIGSVIFDAGVNIPIISGVVLGGAGNSDITLIQRIGRGARNCEYADILGYLPEFMNRPDGRKVTKVYDVMDANAKFFVKQSRNRYKNACAEFGKDRVHIKGFAAPPPKKTSSVKVPDNLEAALAQFKMMEVFKNE